MGSYTYGNRSSRNYGQRPYNSDNKTEASGSSYSGGSSRYGKGSGYGSGGSYGRNRSSGNSRWSPGNRGGASRRRSFNFSESMFIKKAVSTAEEVKYVPKLIFQELDISPILKKNIEEKKFDVATPIQDQAISHILNGKDLLGIADTGTGKTAAFLIPLADKVTKNRSSRVLIITPTRELADQINQDLKTLTRGMKIFSVECIGGNNIRNQIFNLRRGYSFVIGTPGRLKDLSNRKVLDLSSFNTVVLDEVDRMLDMGFVNEIKHLISFLPTSRQSLCFSATVDKKVEEIIDMIAKKDRVKISVKTGETAKNVEQDIIRVDGREGKILKLEELLNSEGFEKVLVFANTKREVDRLDKHLYQKGYKVESIHGERRQNERKRAIDSFKTGRSKVLIATDVAARGLDINNVTHVINYDIPMTYEDYIHRVGRTGRANKKGMALTFVERRGYVSRGGVANRRYAT